MEGRTDIGGFFGLELPEYGNFLSGITAGAWP